MLCAKLAIVFYTELREMLSSRAREDEASETASKQALPKQETKTNNVRRSLQSCAMGYRVPAWR